jgi:hypothetical protein
MVWTNDWGLWMFDGVDMNIGIQAQEKMDSMAILNGSWWR